MKKFNGKMYKTTILGELKCTKMAFLDSIIDFWGHFSGGSKMAFSDFKITFGVPGALVAKISLSLSLCFAQCRRMSYDTWWRYVMFQDVLCQWGGWDRDWHNMLQDVIKYRKMS